MPSRQSGDLKHFSCCSTSSSRAFSSSNLRLPNKAVFMARMETEGASAIVRANFMVSATS